MNTSASQPAIGRDLAALRALFPVTEHWTYLLNGSICPCPRPVQRAIEQFTQQWADGGEACWPVGYALMGELKERFARLVGVTADEIAVVDNTTTALNLAATMIAPAPGSNVVVTDLAFMSSTYPWLMRESQGVEVRFVKSRGGEIRLDDLAALVDRRTAAVTVCHVAVGSGFRFDLAAVAEIAHGVGAYLVVDVAQSAGAIQVDLRRADVDFAAGTTSKWLLGPTGIGLLYVNRQHVERFTPPVAGWLSAENVADWDLYHPRLHRTAMRFQGGMPNLLGIAGAVAGLRLLESLGTAWVEQEITTRATYLWEQLRAVGVDLWTPADPGKRAGLVFFRTPGYEELHARLTAERVYTGKFLGGIRVDPSFYNTDDELDKLVDIVADSLPGTR